MGNLISDGRDSHEKLIREPFRHGASEVCAKNLLVGVDQLPTTPGLILLGGDQMVLGWPPWCEGGIRQHVGSLWN